MGTTDSTPATAVPSPQDLIRYMSVVDWNNYFTSVGTDNKLELLESLDVEVERLRGSLRQSLLQLWRQLEEMPPEVQIVCDKRGAQSKAEMKATVPYILKILPRVHANKRLKRNVRLILGLGNCFSLNLFWAGMWHPLMDGCGRVLRRLGEPLEHLYKRDDLRQRLGDFEPALHSNTTTVTTTTTTTSAMRDHTTTARAQGVAEKPIEKVPSLLKQYIPPQCGPSAFTHHFSIANEELEAVYIHFLRLLAIAMDDAFQRSVKDTLASANVSGSVSSGGIKSYQRMFMKMQSKNDHAKLPPPRPAHNLDVVRCLVTFDTVSGMRKAFDIMGDVFSSGYLKFKNGYRWTADQALERYYLRFVLSAGKFEYTARKTIGELRSDPHVKSLWQDYLCSGSVPPFVAPEKWCRHAKEAYLWLHTLPADTDMWMICEVQMLLQSAASVRSKMHETYKVARAPTEAALDQEFSSYARAYQAQEDFDNAGNTDFHRACRDGAPVTVARLVQQQDVNTVGRGLEIAATYARRTCVDILSGQANVSTEHLSVALRAVADGYGERDLGKLKTLVKTQYPDIQLTGVESGNVVELEDDLRRSIAHRLLKCKAAVDAKDPQNRTALHLASERGYAKVVQLLISQHADLDNAENGLGKSCLHVAATSRVIDLLCAAKADVGKVKKSGGGAVETHASRNNVECVQALIRAKAEINTTRPDGTTALFMAAFKGRVGALSLLLQAKASVNILWKRSISALIMATRHGHVEVISLLIAAKADLDQSDHGGVASLFTACRNGNVDVAAILMAAKADIDRRSNSGFSPLSEACYNGHAEIAGMLVDAGANYTNTTRAGTSAIARASRHPHVVAVLRERIRIKESQAT